MRYAVVIEQASENYSAYVPDLPGCVAIGDTLEEIEQMIREAIEFHLEMPDSPEAIRREAERKAKEAYIMTMLR